MDQPDSKAAGRSVQVARAGPSNQSRPMSADDIQKAKMRAMFMQNKYGKSDVSTPENLGQKSVNREISSAQIIKTTPSSRIAQLPHTKRNEDKKPLIPIRKPSPVKMETDSKPNKTSREHLLERLKSVRTQWHSPPGTVALLHCMFKFVMLNSMDVGGSIRNPLEISSEGFLSSFWTLWRLARKNSWTLFLCLSVSISLLNIYHSTCFGWAGYVEEFTTGIGEAIFLAIFATRPAATIQSC